MNLSPASNYKKSLEIKISGSKSESNRLLILQQLFPNLTIENLSNSDDTKVLQQILENPNLEVADVHHAGTAMRFLTAFFACQKGKEIILKGSERMHERPIKILVDALRELGAEILYLENLLNGLKINLIDEVTSRPYIEMTLNLLNQIGIKTEFENQTIKVYPTEKINTKTIEIEADWSSASYWYSVIALSEIDTKITLSSYKKNSLQGDNCLVEIYKNFGVETEFLENKICLIKQKSILHSSLLTLNLKNAPDIAQTIAVTCLGLGIECKLTGLKTLKIKETDRLSALKNEIEKFKRKYFCKNLQRPPNGNGVCSVVVTSSYNNFERRSCQ